MTEISKVRDGQVREIKGSPRRMHGLGAALASVVLVVLLMALLLWMNPRYYFVDDRISETMPKFLDIGRSLRRGEMPWLTTDFISGGGHAVEYLHAVFNPLNLVLCLWLTSVQDLAIGAFVYIVIHAVVLTLSAAWLGLRLGLTPSWTIAFAVSVGFQPYTIVWNASAWSQGFISFAWLALSVAAAVAYLQDGRKRHGWILLAATYGAFTSGWPLVVPMLSFFVLVLALACGAGKGYLRAGGLLVWHFAGAASSLVAIYPLLTASAVSARSQTLTNLDNFNVAPIEGLLQFSNPGFYGFFNNFGGYELQSLPHFYVAWFLVPIFVFARRDVLSSERRVLFRSAAICCAAALLASLGPERLLVFRYPNRFLQYFAFFALLLAMILVAQRAFIITKARIRLCASVMLLLPALSLQEDPAGALRIALAFAAVSALAALLVWSQLHVRGTTDRRTRAQVHAGRLSLVAGTTVILAALAVAHPSGRGVDWAWPADVGALPALSTADYTLYYGNYLPAEAVNERGYSEFHPSTMGVMVGDRQLNGYSPLGNRFFREHFPLDDAGNFQPGGAAAFTASDAVTGKQMLELLRVDQVISILGPMDEEVSSQLGSAWQSAARGAYTQTYRHEPYRLPGLISHADPGLSLEPVVGCGVRAARECVQVTSIRQSDGMIVFARPWMPGYRASFDGKPAEIERHAGMLVAIRVPPGADGPLVVSYRSPGFIESLSLAAIIVLLLALYSTRRGGHRWVAFRTGVSSRIRSRYGSGGANG